MGKRVSIPQPSSTMTLAEAEEVMGIYAKADASIEKINATMDLEISKIRDKYKDKIAAHTLERDEAETKLNLFCTQNKDTYFSSKKTLQLSHGDLGFRTGTPALKPRKSFTLSACLELAKQFLPDYVRTKQELDREALIAARSIDGMEEKYVQIGVQIVQEEKWFIELKKEAVPA
jgi:phage host-nuclease inhibitor protein Gam